MKRIITALAITSVLATPGVVSAKSTIAPIQPPINGPHWVFDDTPAPQVTNPFADNAPSTEDLWRPAEDTTLPVSQDEPTPVDLANSTDTSAITGNPDLATETTDDSIDVTSDATDDYSDPSIFTHEYVIANVNKKANRYFAKSTEGLNPIIFTKEYVGAGYTLKKGDTVIAEFTSDAGVSDRADGLLAVSPEADYYAQQQE